MKKLPGRWFIVICLALLCCCMCFAVPALAAEAIEIVLPSGTVTTVDYYKDISVLLSPNSPMSGDELVLSSGWYAVTENTTIDKRVRIDGAVCLILCDNTTLTLNKGIHLRIYNELDIFAPPNGTGWLIATGEDMCSAIGGNADQAGGSLYVEGGNVVATSNGMAAGIGGGGMGGSYTGSQAGGYVTVNRGTLTATSNGGGAGIGCGAGAIVNGGSLEINGGTVTARANYRTGDGVGGDGIDGSCLKSIYIYGGTLIASSNTETSNTKAIVAERFEIGDNIQVRGGYDADSATLAVVTANSDGRRGKFQQHYAKTTVCDHSSHDPYYPVSDTSHKFDCRACKTVIREEPHDYSTLGGICSVCGMSKFAQVVVDPGEADGNALAFFVDRGPYGAPDCTFSAPARKVFKGWAYGDPAVLLQPGDPIDLPLTEGVHLTALWQYPELVVDGVTYTGWADDSTLPTTPGCWYLMNDVDSMTDCWTVPQGETILNLNGNRIWRGAMGNSTAANGSVIKVPQGASLTIRDTAGGGRIHGGNATQGGAVYLAGTFHLEGGRIGADQVYNANKANDGAAVYITQTGTMVMTGGAIDHNTTLQHGGGAITNYGSLTITGGSITNNTAKASGGAIWSNTGVSISGATISGNTASGDGAGVCIRGGQSTITNATISGNTASGSNYGGGISITGGALTMSGVTVSGNTAGSNGGGLYTEVSVTLNDCVFTGNKANNGSGGGVYMPGGITVNLNGGTFTGNTATQNGGGVHVSKTATLNISGLLKLYNNKRGSAANNLNLAEGAVAHVIGDIDAASQIGISVSNVSIGNCRAVTTGLSGRGSASCFFSDDSTRATGASTAGETLLGVPVTLTMQSFESAGALDSIVVSHSSVVALPECSFMPQNMVFLVWQIDGADYSVGDTLTLTTDKTATALWQSEWVDFQQQIDSAANDATLALAYDLNAQLSEGPLEIPEGKTLTIDLNGHSIDRGLNSETTYGNVITVNGYLTLIDSVGGGAVTGGNNYGSGGGVVNNGTLVMQVGPSISWNAAREAGGVYNAADAVFIMNGGTIAHNSSSRYNGGGVSNFGHMTMTGGSISSNTTAQHGGGVWTNKVLTMTGGSICDNAVSAQSTNGQGGGVCLDAGTMHLFGGTISGNSAKYGGGISEYESRVDALKIQGSPVVVGNTAGTRGDNIRLYSNYVLKVAGALSDTAQIGVTPDTAYKAGFEPPFIITNGLSGKGTAANFICEVDGYTLALDASGEAALFNNFGSPDFILPAYLQCVEAQAFESTAITVADIPYGCESIGDYAFRNCSSLAQIRIPASVTSIGDGVFDGCGTVWVYGAAGSAADNYCAENSELIFIVCED